MGGFSHESFDGFASHAIVEIPASEDVAGEFRVHAADGGESVEFAVEHVGAHLFALSVDEVQERVEKQRIAQLAPQFRAQK